MYSVKTYHRETNTEALLNASNQAGLEVNTEERSVILPSYQNAEQICVIINPAQMRKSSNV
jgi:hypothetical protein